MEGMEHPHLPWSLTVHFQDYPKDVLTRRENAQSLQDIWLNNLKEVSPFTHPPRYPSYIGANIDVHVAIRLSKENIHITKHSNPISISVTARPRFPHLPLTPRTPHYITTSYSPKNISTATSSACYAISGPYDIVSGISDRGNSTASSVAGVIS